MQNTAVPRMDRTAVLFFQTESDLFAESQNFIYNSVGFGFLRRHIEIMLHVLMDFFKGLSCVPGHDFCQDFLEMLDHLLF